MPCALLILLHCLPTVESSDGSGAALQGALKARSAANAPQCPDMRIRVERTGPALTVRRAAMTRTVPDVPTAAVLVETWLNADLADPLLAVRAAPASPAPQPPIEVAQTPVTQPAPRALHVDLSLALGGASDRTAWGGVHTQGCLMLGPVCTGVRAQVAADPGIKGNSENAKIWRLSMGVLAVGDLTWRPVRLGVGLGLTSVRIDAGRGQDDDVRGAPMAQVRVQYDLPLSNTWDVSAGLIGEWAGWGRQRSGRGQEEPFPQLPSTTVLASLGMHWNGQ